MKDQPEPAPERDSLEIDLAQSFLPAWAREGEGKTDVAKLAARFDHGHDRPERHSGSEKYREGRRQPRPERETRSKDRPRRDDRARSSGKERREDSFERRPDRPQRPKREETPAISGWQVRFLPDRTGLDGLARQIKSSMKAYPLFDLARLVLEKSERYQVELKRTDTAAPTLFQLKSDGSLWTDESAAISHALNDLLETYYRREQVTVEPPKGNFTGVAQCGLSNILLGPPNYHNYQTKLRETHAQKFSNMSFDAYAARVRIVKDEALIEQWKQEQCSVDQFVPIPSEQPDQAVNDTTAESVTPLATMADVETHFRTNHADKLIIKIRDRVIAPGPSAMNSSAPAVLALTRAYWAELDRFPLPLAHSLSKQLTARGLQIFKAHDNITFISIARPRFLDIAANPVSDALRTMLEYIQSHPFQPRPEQWKALTALRVIPEGGSESDRDNAVAADLSWLLHAGHVIDYAKRGLSIAPR